MSALALAAVSSVSAQDAHTLKLAPLRVTLDQHTKEAIIDFTVQDNSDGAYTACSYKALGAVTSDWILCTDRSSSFNFATQIDDIEYFKFLVGHLAAAPIGSVIAQDILNHYAGSPVYRCTDRAAPIGLETDFEIVDGSDVIAQPVKR
ncbi:hypothetical protein BJX66DRAFT_336889 [Aspergillus keveii]|uniref:AA1-like domain-containing protein n=1 Tax=Aspergillus keveii TaxID=714993 RepID=A0ABR4GA68_9EURO